MTKQQLLPRNVAIAKLDDLLMEVEHLRDLKGVNDMEFVQWKEKVRMLMPTCLGKEHLHSFMNEYLGIPGILNGTIRTKKQYLELLSRVEALLEGVKYSIDDSTKTQVPIPEKTDIDKVLHLCERFESFARIFCSSPHGKCKLVPILSNEYDLQHIFYSLLALDFDHIQPEEPTPTFAASFTKMDFYLKEERIGIELKYATKANGEKQIKKDLLEDIPQYSTDIVDHIVCFIYDPQKEIKQPINFKSTFEKHSNTKAKVHVVIAS